MGSTAWRRCSAWWTSPTTLRAERREGREVTIEVEGADVGPAGGQPRGTGRRSWCSTPPGDRFGVHLDAHQANSGPAPAWAAARATPPPRCIAVNRLASDAMPRHELLQFAARLGSDVPFFLAARRSRSAGATASGCSGCRRCRAAPALLVTPPVPIAHRRGVRLGGRGAAVGGPAGRGRARSRRALDAGATSAGWRATISSRRFRPAPRIRAAFEALVGTRPLVCRMSGSGSTLFAIYRSRAGPRGRADDAGPEARGAHCRRGPSRARRRGREAAP